MSSIARTGSSGEALRIACLSNSVVLGVDNLFTEYSRNMEKISWAQGLVAVVHQGRQLGPPQ